jgi:hypothetical protein
MNRYWLHIDYPTSTSIAHDMDCPFARDGYGVCAGLDERNRMWRGRFATPGDALAATTTRIRRCCKYCLPSQ